MQSATCWPTRCTIPKWSRALSTTSCMTAKKGVAQKIVYEAFDIVKEKTGNDPLESFEKALENIMPVLEVKARRVGGSTYQVPMEVRPRAPRDPWPALADHVFPQPFRAPHEPAPCRRDYGRVQRQRRRVQKARGYHKMAEANKAFAHYRY